MKYFWLFYFQAVLYFGLGIVSWFTGQMYWKEIGDYLGATAILTIAVYVANRFYNIIKP